MIHAAASGIAEFTSCRLGGGLPRRRWPARRVLPDGWLPESARLGRPGRRPGMAVAGALATGADV